MTQEQLTKKILKVIPIIGVPLFFSIFVALLFLLWGDNDTVVLKIIVTQVIVLGLLIFTDKALNHKS